MAILVSRNSELHTVEVFLEVVAETERYSATSPLLYKPATASQHVFGAASPRTGGAARITGNAPRSIVIKSPKCGLQGDVLPVVELESDLPGRRSRISTNLMSSKEVCARRSIVGSFRSSMKVR
jgi:hypothetical protein